MFGVGVLVRGEIGGELGVLGWYLRRTSPSQFETILIPDQVFCAPILSKPGTALIPLHVFLASHFVPFHIAFPP